MLGLIPENGSRTECMASLVAVYERGPVPGELYQLDIECTYIDTGVTVKERTFLHVQMVCKASGLVTFLKMNKEGPQAMQYSLSSWQNLSDHNNFKWIGYVP